MLASKIGRAVDTYKGLLVGPFDYRYLRDAIALLCVVPGQGRLIRALNELLRPLSRMKNPPKHTRIIGQPHSDGRIITCLASDRDVIRTELYDGKRWVELPMTPDALYILPNSIPSEYRVEPTFHRVLHIGQDARSPSTRPNVTLVVGVWSPVSL